MNNEVLDMIMHKFSLLSLSKLSMEAFLDIYKDLSDRQKGYVNNHIVKACILMNSLHLVVPKVMTEYLATPDCELEDEVLYQAFILAIRATEAYREYQELLHDNRHPLLPNGISDYVKEGIEIVEF